MNANTNTKNLKYKYKTPAAIVVDSPVMDAKHQSEISRGNCLDTYFTPLKR